MTQIATDLRNTIETARRIRFESSAANSATNVQDALSGTLGPFPSPTVVTATGAISASAVDVQVNAGAPVTLTAPLSATWAATGGRYGSPLSIFDISGAASTNNITIAFSGGETVDGLATLIIASDYGGFRLKPKSGGGWIVA